MNLVEYLFRAARESGRWRRPAILYEGGEVTYDQLFDRVKKFGGALRALGVGRGDRVGLVAADCPEWVVSFLGAAAAGAVAVPASTVLQPGELEYVLGHCGARAAVITPEQAAKLQSVRANLPQLEHVLLVGEESDLGASAPEAERHLSFADVIGGADGIEVEPLADDALAFILYTSGSTGRPKGATHTHGNLPYTVEHCCKQALGVAPEDRLFSSSRLFFAYGLGNSLSFPLGSGATTILCRERPTPAVIARVFDRHRPTIFFGVPAVFRALLEYAAQGNRLDTGSVKFCVSAGEKLPARVYAEWEALTGLEILDGIGSTEMLQMFITNARGRVVPGSSGRVVPGYEAKLLDEEGREVSGAGAGQLFVKGGSASPGYWDDPDKTADTMRGEWMRTGDLYRRDADGFYWFEGRADDLFKVKGLWVSPVEVEDALLACPDVLEAAVVPGVNEDGLNEVAAYVVVRPEAGPEAATLERLTAHSAARLPPYKRPARFHFTEELPRTATGKLQRFKLRGREQA